ncbi:uncharacterized protein LOC128984048 [Macrosteles quadrilineatus]|uniref:uncharacterized protein LOC128984048 n=1 Tax=Macrosteles quadrilineatus TaxID=74068 RepID=UPI0023E2CDC1|nr:uncharacterized protein LOC128984048 [Macrosteles quadrilineatus]
MLLHRTYQPNPVLEIKRDGYLAEEKEVRDNYVASFKSSIAKTKHLHANILFTTQCGRMILQDICCLVTCINASVVNKDWNDLAVALGYSGNEVKCINNFRGDIYDPTELTLKYYAATKDGTIADVLQALLDLGFLPALREAEKHINTLLIEVEGEKKDLIETPTKEEDNGIHDKILNVVKAANFKPFVPAIFNPIKLKDVSTSLSGIHTVKENERIQTSKAQSKKGSQKYCKYVMLSFANDGHSTALRVASVFRATTNKKGLPIGVLMLCENDNQILENPGQIIPDIIAKMDYVVPVLTEGYFRALKEPDLQARLLDERYIQFIHDILVSKYIRNSCLNIEVRSVIPNNSINSVYFKEDFIHHSIFNAWKSEDEIQILADSIVKHKRIVAQ